MPKKADPSKKNASGIYRSQIKWTEKFESSVEKIILRVPEGSRAAITEYVNQKAEEDPENLKYSSFNGKAYRPSVNALIRSLLEEEMGINLDDLKDSE